MEYKKGERVKHPKKLEWGIGQVLADSKGDTVTIFFDRAGEKTIALAYVQPALVTGEDAVSVILDSIDFSENASSSGKAACENCGQPTQFDAMADSRRRGLGWCEPCFKHSKRTFEEKETGQKRYFDEFRTIYGIKSRHGPH